MIVASRSARGRVWEHGRAEDSAARRFRSRAFAIQRETDRSLPRTPYSVLSTGYTVHRTRHQVLTTHGPLRFHARTRRHFPRSVPRFHDTLRNRNAVALNQPGVKRSATPGTWAIAYTKNPNGVALTLARHKQVRTTPLGFRVRL